MKCKFVMLFCVVNGILSIVAICVALPTTSINFDYLGFLVGVLSFLVTLLLGWNIYTTIDFNKHRLDIIKLERSMRDSTSRAMAVSEGNLYMAYHAIVFGETPTGNEAQMLLHGVTSLFHSSKFHDIKTCDVMVKALLENLSGEKQPKVSKEHKRTLMTVLSSIEEPNKIKNFVLLYDKVLNLPIAS